MPTPADHDDTALGPPYATSLKTPLPTCPSRFFRSLQGDLHLRVVVGDRDGESPKDLRRMTNLCGVLRDVMAKVERRRHVQIRSTRVSQNSDRRAFSLALRHLAGLLV